MYNKQTTHSIIARGSHTSYIDTDPNASPKTPVILCLHGLATSNFMYRNVIDDLAFNARVIAPDLPGFGLSQKQCPWELSLENYSLWLTDFIEQVVGSEQRIHLLVHDMSGPIGLGWTLSHKHRVKSLLLLNTTIFIEHFRPPMVALAGAIPQFGSKLVDWAMQGQRLKQGWQRAFTSPIGTEDLEQYCAPFDDQHARLALSEVFSLFPGTASYLNRLRRQLGTLQVPCSILFGASDKYCKAVNATAFAQAIDGACLRFIQDVGHFIAEEAPYAVSEEMRELMKKSGERLTALSPVAQIDDHRNKLAS